MTWRTTGGVIAGAAVLGAAAATAQASVLTSGDAAPASATAAAVSGRKDVRTASSETSRPSSRATKKERSKTQPEASSSNRPRLDEPEPQASEKTPEPERPTAAEAIALARSQVGVAEDAGGETKFQKWYMGTSRAQETLARDGGSLDGYGDANWCDMFISWVGERLGFTAGMGSDAWTVAHARWFQQNGRWGTTPRPGAIVFYAWSGGKDSSDIRHVGMVIKKVDDTTIEAVEGNTGNAVRVKTRSADDIVGYGYPDYRS
ncbi:CHAP domain-containing protein [Actinomadura decatromicini]|uniref:CHAP domain-containing protein n=1 Tax=Actinomadura decatromicini TaxID=2604572 RepID=A0A5D3FKN9_9ACTN|nr:CHAP domain-containing protein [Actinomadura decatromicini]